MNTPKPCPAEAAATLCDELAAAMDRDVVHPKARADLAAALERVPILHALRDYPTDRVFEVADLVRRGQVTPEGLRAFAEELRAGAPAMRERGWWPTVGGAS
jgi:propanediol dehydratase small subunit